MSATQGRSRGPWTTCGPSRRAGFALALADPGDADVGAADEAGALPPGGSSAGCGLGLVQPGSPAAVKLACDKLILPELTHLLEELAR